jgi:tetratricopeptide (TPR) repeat protein
VTAVRGVLVVLAVASFPSLGRAESVEAQVERLASEAVNAYKGADYNRAVELLQKAYEIRQVPALLYNMAKAYDKLGDVEHAADAYRRYADSADADPKLKSKAEARLATLDESRRKKAAADHPPTRPEPGHEAPPVVAPAPPIVTAAPPPAPVPALSEAEQIRDKLKRERQSERHRARLAALGVGLATVAVGGVAIGLSSDALVLQNQWASQYGGNEDTRRALKNDAVTRAGVADGFFALTAVGAGVTAYFLYRGFRPEPNAPSLAIAPTATGALLTTQGRF